MIEKARKHLQELGAFDSPNPTLAKAIAMRRLMDDGAADDDALMAINRAFAGGRFVPGRDHTGEFCWEWEDDDNARSTEADAQQEQAEARGSDEDHGQGEG